MKNFKNYSLSAASPIIRIDEKDIPKVLLTSDWHFGHKNILKYCSADRPWSTVEDMQKGIIENTINELQKLPTIGSIEYPILDGYLINCGDIVFGGGRDSVTIFVEEIQKKLPYISHCFYCLGNHDINNLFQNAYLDNCGISDDGENCSGFSNVFIMEIYRDQKCILRFTISHYPMKSYYGSFNLHGHLHTPSKYKIKLSQDEIDKMITENEESSDRNPDLGDIIRYSQDSCHYDVGLDFNDNKPVWLKDILEGKLGIDPKVFNNIKFNY